VVISRRACLAVSEGMSTLIANTILRKVAESSFPPSQSPITDPSVVEDTDAIVGKEIEEQTQSSIRVVETKEGDLL